MSTDPDQEIDFGPDPRATPAMQFISKLRDRLALQERVQNAPTESSRLIPYLAVSNATRAIEFYNSVFDAQLGSKPFLDDSGHITHAELNIRGTVIYLSDEFAATGVLGPQPGAGHPVSLVIEVADADLTMAAAVAGGAAVERPVQDQWGSRSGWFVDPFGHRWSPTSRTDINPTGVSSDN